MRLALVTLCIVCCVSPALADSTGSVYDFQATWTDINGGPVPISAWKGERVYLTMFYSDCERVCVRTLNVLESIEKKLREESRGGVRAGHARSR